MHLGGVTTNRDFLVATLRHEAFLAGDTTTDFIERNAPAMESTVAAATTQQLAIAAAMWLQGDNRASARVLDRVPSGWRNARMPAQHVALAVDDVEHDIGYRRRRDGSFAVEGGQVAIVHRWSPDDLDVEVDGIRRTVRITLAAGPSGEHLHLTGGGTTTTFRVVPRFSVPGSEAPSGGLVAPMPGRVLEIRAAMGDTVTKGQTMLLLEAMKMEHHMTAPFDGTVTEVRVATGDQVDNGSVLLVINPTDDGSA